LTVDGIWNSENTKALFYSCRFQFLRNNDGNVEPLEEAIDMIREAGGEAFKLCFQCGLCTASCPWNTVSTFMPHRMICESRYGLVDLENEGWWMCTTCNQCVERCPRGVAITDVLGSVRKILLDFEYRMAPASLRSAMGSLSGAGNPWGGDRETGPTGFGWHGHTAV
jgi:heterodisulfide reductase subunit C